jgi:predicted DNA-binding protein
MFYLPLALREQFAKVAEQKGIGSSELLRRIIERYLEEVGKTQQEEKS